MEKEHDGIVIICVSLEPVCLQLISQISVQGAKEKAESGVGVPVVPGACQHGLVSFGELTQIPEVD